MLDSVCSIRSFRDCLDAAHASNLMQAPRPVHNIPKASQHMQGLLLSTWIWSLRSCRWRTPPPSSSCSSSWRRPSGSVEAVPASSAYTSAYHTEHSCAESLPRACLPNPYILPCLRLSTPLSLGFWKGDTLGISCRQLCTFPIQAQACQPVMLHELGTLYD